MAITMADEAPRVMVTRNRRIPGARYFGPYPKMWAVRETIDLMVKAFPMRTCSDSSYQRAMAERPAVLPRPDRALRRPVLAEGDDRGAPGDRRAVRRVHGQPRPQRHHEARARDEARLRRDASTRRPRSCATASTRSRTCSRRARSCSPDGVDTDVFGIEHDELAAAVQQFVVRGGRVRGVRSWVVDKELDVPLRRTRRIGAAERIRGHARPPHEIIVPALPDDAAVLETWLAGMRRAGRGRAAHGAQRGDKAKVLEMATLNAKQALALYKTRRIVRLRVAQQRADRHPGRPGARRGAAAHGVLRRLAPRRHQHRRLDGRVRRRTPAQERVPQVRHPRVRRRHRGDLPGAQPPLARLEDDETRDRARRGRGRAATGAPSASASPTARD